MKKRNYKAIFFDLGGTLIYPDHLRIKKVFSQQSKLEADDEKWFSAIHHATKMLDQEYHKTPKAELEWWSAYFKHYLSFLFPDHKFADIFLSKFVKALKKEHLKKNLWAEMADNCLETLERLKQADKRMAIISNSDGQVMNQLREHSLDKYFEVVLDSHIVGVSKPQAAIFLIALQKTALSPKEVLYVGDFFNVDIIGAANARIDGLLIDPENLREKVTRNRIASLKELPDWLGI